MNWISEKYLQLRGRLKPEEENAPIPLGKYSPAPWTEYQLAARESATQYYQDKKWPDYALRTLDYLFGEHKTKGYYEQDATTGEWKLGGVHGSIYFEGLISADHIHIDSHILRTCQYQPSMLRRLLESSVEYDFIRYGITDDCDIVTSVHLERQEADPRVLYAAIRELCLNADIYDSDLATEYENVQWLNQDHVTYDDDRILDIKYDYYTTELAEVRDYVQKVFQQNNKDLLKISYHLLGYIYKTDYLISPGNFLFGYFMDRIDEYWSYVGQPNSDFAMATAILRDSIEDMPEMSRPEFREEAVHLPYLFSVRSPMDLGSIINTMKSNLPNLKKFKEDNDYISLYWCTHVMIGGIVFHYDLDIHWHRWISLLYATTDSLYMSRLGYLPAFLQADSSSPDLHILRDRLRDVIEQSQKSDHPLPPLPEKLNMDDPLSFIYDVLMVFEK